MNKRSNVHVLLYTPFKSNICGLAGFFSLCRGGGEISLEYPPKASLLEPPCERIIDLLVQQSDTDLKPLITGRDQQGSSFIPWHTACTALTAFLPCPSLWSLRSASPHVSHHRRTAKTDIYIRFYYTQNTACCPLIIESHSVFCNFKMHTNDCNNHRWMLCSIFFLWEQNTYVLSPKKSWIFCILA